MKHFLSALAVFIAALMLSLTTTLAAAPAFDSASDIQYGPADPTPPVGAPPGWWDPTGSDNGGFGYAPWLGAVGAGGGGFFMGTSVGNGNALDDGIIGGVPGDSDIDTMNPTIPGLVSWGVFSGAGSVVEMVRPFAGGPLLPGETFSIDLDNGFVAPGGVVGLTLQVAPGVGLPGAATAFELGFAGGAGTYYFIDATTGGVPVPTAIPFMDEGMTFTLTMTGPLAYVATVTPKGGVPIAVGGGLLIAPILQARIFSFSNPGGPPADMFANSMSIIPEPTAFALVGLGLLGTLALRRRQA